MFRVSGILEQAIASRLFDLDAIVLESNDKVCFHCGCGAGCDGGCYSCAGCQGKS